MSQSRTVGEVMTANPISVVETASLAEAASILDTRKISGLPVVDADGTLVGVLSQTDLVRARAKQHLVANWPGLATRYQVSQQNSWASKFKPAVQSCFKVCQSRCQASRPRLLSYSRIPYSGFKFNQIWPKYGTHDHDSISVTAVDSVLK